MSGPAVFDVVKARFDDEWDGDAVPVWFENETWDLEASPDAFLSVELSGDLFGQASIGSGDPLEEFWREDGELRIHVLVPQGGGTATARTLAKQAADLFRGRELSGVKFRNASLGAGQPGTVDGNYYRFTATIDYQYDEVD